MKTSTASDLLVNFSRNNKVKKLKVAFQYAFPHTIPMLTSVTVLGITYGVLMRTKGYGVLWSTLMSAIAFWASMQFAVITMLTVTFTPIQAFLLSFLVNARHLFYGIKVPTLYCIFRKQGDPQIYYLPWRSLTTCNDGITGCILSKKYFNHVISL